MLAPPVGLAPPPTGNPGSAPAMYSTSSGRGREGRGVYDTHPWSPLEVGSTVSFLNFLNC